MKLQRGASGDPVLKVQNKLKQLGFYLGPSDGSFGGGTESAVKSYQKSRGLEPDGIVGENTWKHLFPSLLPPVSDMLSHPVTYRCVALSGSFETSTRPPECFCGLTGDFDGQGISFGALQWNFGQGTLQPLLRRMIEQHRAVCESIFHENLPVLEAVLKASKAEQMRFARDIQDSRCSIVEPWRGMFKALGRTEECRNLQMEQAAERYAAAVALAAEYGLASERAVALMFDIIVQNGSIGPVVKAQILRDFAAAPSEPGPERELARMRIIANRRAEAAKAKFVEDVRNRKLTIAEGRGTVHGLPYDLEEQFGLRLEPFPRTAAVNA